MKFNELLHDTPVWVRVLFVIQLVAYLFLMISIVAAIQVLTELDWSHGLEGVILKIWKGK